MKPNLLLLLLALAACTDNPAGKSERASSTSVQHTSLAILAGEPGQVRFASYRDAGRVAFIDPTRAAYRSGPHFWQPVDFSEAHALRALQDGRLMLPLASGGVSAVHTLRHIEHADGNWTLIGKTVDGGDAVITFGPDAVFGSAHTAGGTVRLTTDVRGGWLVSSPRGYDDLAAGSGVDDTLLPPARAKLVAGVSRLAPATRGVAKITEAAAAQTDPVVDVVVGFTSGFAQARGGDSAARTRVNNLMEVTNQAYANSGLGSRVRLVHAMQVEFPDATANGDALSKLTGYDVATGTVPVAAALQPLRSAREHYYGDVAVLLRPLRSPESEGCGVAWLLGSRQTTIDASDSAFGFAVVSDGSDVNETDGKNYFCREESFAHELGHLMGQVHNLEESSNPGAHAYSYGYRQTTSNGFYTVMAYRLNDSSQQGIRYFSNPQITYNGIPTGVADQSDNIRSLQQTMPLIAAFRTAPQSTVRRVVNDLDADGLSDMVWQGPQTDYFETWRMESQRLARALGFQLPAGQRVLTAGDLNGDRKLDLIVRSEHNTLFFYAGNGVTFSVEPVSPGVPPAGWQAIGSSDIDGDGNHDLLWLHPNSNQFQVWLMQGALIRSTRTYTMAADTRVVTTGDFGGDGKADVLVINAARELSMWLGNGSGFTPQRLSITNPIAPGWYAWGDIDMNADGRADLLWSTPATSYFEWWNMSSAQVQRASGATPPADQRVAGSGDFNGDGLADMVLKGTANDLHVGISDGILFNRTPFNIVAGPGWLPLVAGQP